MRVSARNVLPAITKQLRYGSVNAEVSLEIAPNIEAVSIMTCSSAEALELAEGPQVYAMIKSSDVMVAVDDWRSFMTAAWLTCMYPPTVKGSP